MLLIFAYDKVPGRDMYVSKSVMMNTGSMGTVGDLGYLGKAACVFWPRGTGGIRTDVWLLLVIYETYMKCKHDLY
jgi:hypothetical protein